MAKRLLLSSLLVLAAAAVGLYVFKDTIRDRLYGELTTDMFVATDADAFDPGLPIGTRLPELQARHGGREISSLEPFMGERGLLLFANRSVDW